MASPKHSHKESDGNVSSEDGDIPEFITVNLAEVRKEVQCPICLDIIRKTKVMECLHRFCKECIAKAMELGNNECPTCGTHCADHRSVRDDPNFDALIAVLYRDIDKYEAEGVSLSKPLADDKFYLDISKDSPSGDGPREEVNPKRCKRGGQSSTEEGMDENELVIQETLTMSKGMTGDDGGNAGE